MKLSLLLTCVLTVNTMASVYSQNTRFNLDIKDQTIRSVLKTIENDSEFRFFYNDEFSDLNKKITFSVNEKNIDELLSLLLTSTDVSYKVMENNFIVITPRDLQQKKIISGVVSDEKGTLLPGVNVVVTGTTLGVTSDLSGKYSIEISEGAKSLTFSFIGMQPLVVNIGTLTQINVSLIESAIGLDEVIVVGYGTQKKSDITGSISSVTSKDMGDRISPDVASLIQGKATGVDVSQGKIRIRGVTTMNNTDPLFVIDGFIGGNLNTINANDIESIEVLKDASSTAIYGSRGANGVILVTTKMGKAGTLKTNVNFFSGVSQMAKTPKVLNADQYVDYALDAIINAGQTPTAKLLSGDVRNTVTNWVDEVFGLGSNTEANFDISGGSEKSTFFLGLGYRNTKSVINNNNDAKQLFIRNKFSFNFNKVFRMGFNNSISYRKAIDVERTDLGRAMNMPPYYGIYDPNAIGGYQDVDRISDYTDANNPFNQTRLLHPDTRSFLLQTQGWVELEFVKGLVLRSQFGAEGSLIRNYTWNDSYVRASSVIPNQLSESYSYSIAPLIETYLTYNKEINKNNLSLMIGNTYQDNFTTAGIGISAQNFTNTEVKNVFYAEKAIDFQNRTQYAYLSYFGRVNYQYNNRYLLTFNMRRDGSPRFAEQNRWGNFPSLALAWKLSEEGFIKNLDFFDLLKLRMSYGVSGNDAIGNFRYKTLVAATMINYPFGLTPASYSGATVKENSSPDIKWESTTSASVGFDFGIYNNRLSGTFDYFHKNTNDILFAVPRPASLGYGADYGGDATINAASVLNTGFEFQLTYQGDIGAFNYSVSANYTNVHNKVTSLGLGQPYLSGVSRTDINHPIGYFYGNVADGIFMTQAELDAANLLAQEKGFAYYQEASTRPGDVKFRDLNGDGHITYDKDRTMIGNSIPKHYYGANILLGYKGFDLNAIFNGIAGSDIYIGSYEGSRGGVKILNQETFVLDRWRSESDPGNGKQPRAISGDPSANLRPSTLRVENGSYLRLKQLSVGYNFSDSFISKIKVKDFRIYFSSNNLLTFTKYSGLEPEVSGDNLVRGIGGNGMPNLRTFVFGLQLGF